MNNLMGKSSYSPAGTATGLKGSGYKNASIQQFTPEQMKLFEGLFSNVGPDSYLSRLAGGDQGIFNQIEAPAMQQFNDFSANIANRYSGMGGVGARRSSGFQNEQTAGASNFANLLQSNRSNLQSQALRDLMSMSSELLGQRPQENFLFQKQPKEQQKSFWEKLFGSILPIAGTAVGGAFGGPIGAQIGGSAGSAFSGAFS